ncbi:neuraminidase-like domain-containing protein [Nonomuraea sp. NPDC048916]|uniref:neuraminidase-like domain-containing protein n=1 Tax=Nonomuraea sp. NPDC048916 TaxID=3154232 RepID=UPI0033C2E422
MDPIAFPLEPGSRGAGVANLHNALQLILERAAILRGDEGRRRELLEMLTEEVGKSFYGDVTAKIVSLFQEERRLEAHGRVDAETAGAIDGLLRAWGLLGTESPPRAYVVAGVVLRGDGLPFPGARVRAFHHSPAGPVRLGEDVTEADGRYTIRYDPLPQFGGIELSVSATGEDGTPIRSSEVVREARPLEIVDLAAPPAPAPAGQRLVRGRIVLEHGAPADTMRIRLYRKGFGTGEALLGEALTRSDGLFSLPYGGNGQQAGLEIRAVDQTGKEIPLSRVLHDLGDAPRSVVNLVAPAALQPLGPEYQRLTRDLAPVVGGLAKLAEARENTERQDLTLLNRSTGWDARLIALAANATRLAAEPQVNLRADALYGLFRAGLPSDRTHLAQVSAEAVDMALKKASEAGIIALTPQETAEFKAGFAAFATGVRLAAPAPGSRSTYADLLRTAEVGEATREKFAGVYVSHRGDAGQLWQAAARAGVPEADITALQAQGKLAFLARNSAPLVEHLQRTAHIADPAQLADRGYYEPQRWVDDITELADNDEQKLAALIPPAYEGPKVGDRLRAYAGDLARKVRLSYPTQVITHRIEHDETDAYGLGDARGATAAWLRSAIGRGFALGRTPVNTFVQAHPDLAEAAGAAGAAEAAGVMTSVRVLQRVYQMTPDDECVPILIGLGLTSAYDVAAHSQEVFLDRYGAMFPSREQARLVYRKAQQVSSVTYNLFTIAKTMDSQAPMYGFSAPPEVVGDVKQELIKRFPTMESLFGSMDYCDCEHCRSVLGPAAYLVDLLQFVDPEPEVWGNFLAHWKTQHQGQSYTDTYKMPYDALAQRRPDLPHIPLTCENTQTALPYIDVVNEILEYYVAHGALDERAAHDTGDATTEELLAEPHNVLAGAYDKLLGARYPLDLPFDLWLETVRAFADYFQAPLWQMLDAFRPEGDGREDVLVEYLGLSPAQHRIFVDPDPLPAWHELYGYASAAEATTPATDPETGQRTDLNSAKALSRRLGLTYQEVTDVVRCGFVNPEAAGLVLLDKLGVTVRDARSYLDHKPLIGADPATLSRPDQERRLEAVAFAERLTGLAATYSTTAAALESELAAIRYDEVLVLADPEAGCSFDLTTLRYASGRAADGIAFLRINLFVRLWRILGWSLEETDRALTVFTAGTPFDAAHLAGAPLRSALLRLARLKALDARLGPGRPGRLRLLTLWSDLARTGDRLLYAQLFLTRGALRTDPVFDDVLGRYLTEPGVLVKDHLLALRGALGLTEDDIRRVLSAADPPLSLDGATLTLPTVSLLYRHALLAGALKLTVAELISLKTLSGLDPFLLDDPSHPWGAALRLAEIAAEVEDAGLTVGDLDHLLRHRVDDPVGEHRPDPESSLALIRTLATGVRAIRAEHAVPADPAAMDEETLRQELALALAPDVVARFLAAIEGTAEFTAVAAGVQPPDRLEAASFAGEPSVVEVGHDPVRMEQKLTFRGVLFDTAKAELLARLPRPAPGAPHVPSPLLGRLLDDVQAQARAFFDKHLRAQPESVRPATGFLEDADFDLLFAPPPPGSTPAQSQRLMDRRRARLVTVFLPHLQRRLIRTFVVSTLTERAEADPALVDGLLTDTTLLGVAGPDGERLPLLDPLAGAAEQGLTLTFRAAPDGSGPPLAAVLSREADTAERDADGQPLRPAGAESARFAGCLEVPSAGAYRFFVLLDRKDARASMRFEHLPEPEFLSGTAPADHAEISEYVELKPGRLYRFSADLRHLGGGGGRLLVRSETLAKDGLPRLRLYPETAVADGERALTLLDKAARLIVTLGLNDREARHILTHPADFGGGSLSDLPTAPATDPDLDTARTLFGWVLRMIGYAALKREPAGGADALIDVFQAPAPERARALLAGLTRREPATVTAAVDALPDRPALTDERAVRRVWDVLLIAERFGAPVDALRSWTAIVDPATGPQARAAIARDLKEAVKARLEPEAWQRVAQPIFDRQRARRRDALVAHVMHRHGFDRVEQLYEYFLIDPGMEPVVRTSRVRLAIGSVQLFVQRCLLNLERDVHPSAVNARHWEWMKRYRVWEANRKIFLFPENWLEPEFRDDKTHLFAELEGALLQGDVSDDLVEDAFLAYLRKLEELARLDIVGMHLEDKADPASNVLHVIGRTYGEPHKYFYHRFAHQTWTPWEPVTTEIVGDHIVPVVWRGRPHVFWVTFADRANPAPPQPAASGGTELAKLKMGPLLGDLALAVSTKIVEVRLHWSEYLNGQWTTHESGESPGTGPLSATVPAAFDPRSVPVHVSKRHGDDHEGVYVHLGAAIGQSYYLAGRNAAPERAPAGEHQQALATPYSATDVRANRHGGSGRLTVTFTARVTTEDGKRPVTVVETPPIMRGKAAYTLLPCDNDITIGVAPGLPESVARAVESGAAELAALTKPVFYQDNTHTMFIEPDVTERTVEEWQEWVTRTPRPEQEWDRPNWWEGIKVIADKPFKLKNPIPIPDDPTQGKVLPESVLTIEPGRDWLVNPGTGIVYDGQLVGPAGRVELAAGVTLTAGAPMAVSPEAALTGAAIAKAGLVSGGAPLNVVGGTGFNAGLAKNLSMRNGGTGR